MKEYRTHIKRLIKKYHPDVCTDDRLKALYSDITKRLTGMLNETKTPDERTAPQSDNGVRKQEDFWYYKQGITYYKNIHPDRWYTRNPDGAFETKPYDELVSALESILGSFALSEYYFQKVLADFPQSVWAEDAKDKIGLLKKLRRRYEAVVLEAHTVYTPAPFMAEMGLTLL